MAAPPTIGFAIAVVDDNVSARPNAALSFIMLMISSLFSQLSIHCRVSYEPTRGSDASVRLPVP